MGIVTLPCRTADAQAVAEVALDLAALLPDAPLDCDTAEQVLTRLARAVEEVNTVAELLGK
jgi:hypothetical protein